MGVHIIGFAVVNVEKDYVDTVYDKLQGMQGVHNLENCMDELSFELSGNNRIDYTYIEELRDWALKEKVEMEITIGEYVEAQDGFYFNSEDYKNEDTTI